MTPFAEVCTLSQKPAQPDEPATSKPSQNSTPELAQVDGGTLHTPLTHASVESLQLVPLQHAWPLPPHWQVPDAHEKLALQMLPLQHDWPLAPHGMHEPPLHRKPLLQVVPPQHGCALPPHLQVPEAQVRFALQLEPPQHACPLAPHWQLPDAHDRFVLQLEPPQHGWPLAPHWQVPESCT
jgi:hypothetical protein